MAIKPILHALTQDARASLEARLAFANPRVPPILIYQMGKVGSTTIYRSLKAASVPNPVLHLHFLSEDLSGYKEAAQQAGLFPIPYHLVLGDTVRKFLIPGVRCKIISLVRDPVALAISAIFENPAFFQENIYTSQKTIDPEKTCRYLEQRQTELTFLDYANEWFDKELKRVFDIDVFADPFALDAGYRTYRSASVEALVLRLEDLSTKGPGAIAEFLGFAEPIRLVRANVRSELSAREAYQKVVNQIRLEESLCREIYTSRFSRHFYSEAMLEAFLLKWTRTEARHSLKSPG